MRSLISLVVLTAACQEYDLKASPQPEPDAYPDIQVDPPVIDFGQLDEGDAATEAFTITNLGEVTLEVSDIDVVVGSDVFSVLSGTEYSIEPGDSVDIDVEFIPYDLEHFGQVEVSSNDPDTPEAPVDLFGLGTPPDTPILQITPDSHNFGSEFVPCGASVELEMRNTGSADLEVTDVSYTSGGLLTFDNRGVGLPFTLAPDEYVTVAVDFEATTEGSDTGTLSVTSNDPRGVVTADQNGEGAYLDFVTESFETPGVAPVDIVFLIDQSCSMGENENTIRNGMPDFLDELANVADWRMIQVTKEGGCGNLGIIDANTPDAADKLSNNAFNGGVSFSNYTEQLLKHADTALSKDAPGLCNEGFLRSGALLHIIIASDERDQSPNTWQHWVTQYEGYVVDPSMVRVSGILDLQSRCGEGAVGPDRYEDAVLATGGSLVDICEPDWGNQLTDIASEVLAGIKSYNLQHVTDEATITVTVNGVATTDFDYEPSGSTVTVNSPPIGDGDIVEITYAEPASCN
jgi:hypothetical protein